MNTRCPSVSRFIVCGLLLAASAAAQPQSAPPEGEADARPSRSAPQPGASAGAQAKPPAGAARSEVAGEPNVENGRFIAMGGKGPQTACFTCHGLQGVGDGTGAFPRLAGQFPFYLYKQMKDYASGTRPNDIMTPIATLLTDAEMEDVAAYYAAMTDAGYAPRPQADPALIQRGGALSAVGAAERGIQACVNCHGPAGVGMGPSFPYLAGQYASYMELQLKLWKQGVRKNDPLGVMEEIAKRMTDEDVRAASLYFETVRPGHEPGDGADGAQVGAPR